MARRRKGDAVDGVMLLDKPTGMTSNKALQIVRRMLNAAKAGHTGSLDPLATGVLPLCFGEATKYSRYLLDADKAYQTTAVFGVITNTGDSDGDVLETRPVPELDEVLTETVLDEFRGPIMQVPSIYSALKYQGRPMYEWARKGIDVPREGRPITIYHLQLLGRHESNTADFEVSCSKGTYIRSLVEDIGLRVGCGAHLNRLRRTKAGHFPLEQTVTMDALEAAFEAGGSEAVKALLQPTDCLLPDMPKIRIKTELSESLFNGQTVRIADPVSTGLVRLYIDDAFVGVGEASEDGSIAPRRLMQTRT